MRYFSVKSVEHDGAHRASVAFDTPWSLDSLAARGYGIEMPTLSAMQTLCVGEYLEDVLSTLIGYGFTVHVWWDAEAVHTNVVDTGKITEVSSGEFDFLFLRCLALEELPYTVFTPSSSPLTLSSYVYNTLLSQQHLDNNITDAAYLKTLVPALSIPAGTSVDFISESPFNCAGIALPASSTEFSAAVRVELMDAPLYDSYIWSIFSMHYLKFTVPSAMDVKLSIEYMSLNVPLTMPYTVQYSIEEGITFSEYRDCLGEDQNILSLSSGISNVMIKVIPDTPYAIAPFRLVVSSLTGEVFASMPYHMDYLGDDGYFIFIRGTVDGTPNTIVTDTIDAGSPYDMTVLCINPLPAGSLTSTHTENISFSGKRGVHSSNPSGELAIVRMSGTLSSGGTWVISRYAYPPYLRTITVVTP